jgi:hypothetical protein
VKCHWSCHSASCHGVQFRWFNAFSSSVRLGQLCRGLGNSKTSLVFSYECQGFFNALSCLYVDLSLNSK